MNSNLMNSTMRHGLILGIVFSVNFILSISGNMFFGLLSYVAVGLMIYLT